MKAVTFKQVLSYATASVWLSGLNLKSPTMSRGQKWWLLLFHSPNILVSVYLVKFVFLETDPQTKENLIGCIFVGTINGIAKLILFTSGRDDLRKLIDIVVGGTDEHNSSNATSFAKAQLQKYTRLISYFAVLAIVIYAADLLVYYILPYFLSLALGLWMKPVAIKIDGLSVNSHPGYDLTILFQINIAFQCVITAIVANIYFQCFSLYIAYKCDICQNYLLMVGNRPKEELSAMLRSAIVTHTEIVRFHSLFSQTFVLFVFVQTTAFTLFAVVSLTTLKYNLSSNGTVIVVLLTQIFVVCLFGEMIKHKFEQTAKAIYTCNWLCLSKRQDRQSFLILLMNGQIARSFNCYGVFDLSMATFIQLLKMMFTYYTFLTEVLDH